MDQISKYFTIAKQTVLNLDYNGQNIVELRLKLKKPFEKIGISRNELKDALQSYSDHLHSQGKTGMISVSTFQEDKGQWRPSGFRSFGDEVRLYSNADSDNYIDPDQQNFHRVILYLTGRDRNTKGGTTEFNDCLYNCFKFVFGVNIDQFIESPAHLKQMLGLQRKDKIDYQLLSKLETKLSIRINVEGDYTYISDHKEYIYEINLILADGHYTVNTKVQYAKKLKSHFREKKPILYKIFDQTIEYYDGIEIKTVPRHKLLSLVRNQIHSDYIWVNVGDKNLSKCFIELFNEFHNDAKLMKTVTKGKINLYKTGTNTSTAEYLFKKLVSYFKPEIIRQDETEWIEKSTCGPIVSYEKYSGKGWKYDICSMYQSILNDKNFLVPLKRGKFTTLTELPKILSYGIYRVKINEKEINKKLFRPNINHYYTHISLNHARALGLNMKLICDDKPNALIYSRDCLINSHKVFSQYINILYKLKEVHKCKRAKQILNCLWGLLSSKNHLKLQINPEEQIIISNPNIYLDKPNPFYDNVLIKQYNQTQLFNYDWARLKPFLIARGRKLISDIIHPYVNDIKYIHTDGFIISKELPQKLLADKTDQYVLFGKLGCLKFEEYSKHCIIENCQKVQGFKTWGSKQFSKLTE